MASYCQKPGLKFFVAILQMIFSNAFYFKEIMEIMFWLKFSPLDAIDNKSILVQIMAWCQTGGKLLSEPMMTVYSQHIASLGHSELLVVLALNKQNIQVKMCGKFDIGGLVQERCNSIANALELHLSCTNRYDLHWAPTITITALLLYWND